MCRHREMPFSCIILTSVDTNKRNQICAPPAPHATQHLSILSHPSSLCLNGEARVILASHMPCRSPWRSLVFKKASVLGTEKGNGAWIATWPRARPSMNLLRRHLCPPPPPPPGSSVQLLPPLLAAVNLASVNLTQPSLYLALSIGCDPNERLRARSTASAHPPPRARSDLGASMP
jgi:hypothetical protein